jgi:hypothetical protein
MDDTPALKKNHLNAPDDAGKQGHGAFVPVALRLSTEFRGEKSAINK